MLKAENLQRTGSFKVRGVATKLATLGEEGCARGVVAASRRQPRAGAGRRRGAARGIPCEVFVPADAPMAKVEAARGQGAIVHVGGDERRRLPGRGAGARRDRRAGVRAPVRRPGDRRRPGLARPRAARGRARPGEGRIPVGGGGLCAGVALAIKAARPDVQIVGVQAAACAPFPESMLAGEPIEATSALTIADGIAVKRPGGHHAADPDASSPTSS